jgi:hypothetical protein
VSNGVRDGEGREKNTVKKRLSSENAGNMRIEIENLRGVKSGRIVIDICAIEGNDFN